MPPKLEKSQCVIKFKSLLKRMQLVETFTNEINVDSLPTQSQIETRITSMEKLYTEYESLLEKSFSLEVDAESDSSIESLVQTIESTYHKVVSRLMEVKVPTVTNPTGNRKIETIKLPEVNIPIFDGKATEWVMFKETFIAVIHSNEKLSNVIKFTYLLDRLKGEAKLTIGHISLSDSGYIRAWEDLLKRYDNMRHIIETHVNEILNLPYATKENCSELRRLLNLSNSHISSLESLGHKLTGLSETFVINSITRKIDMNLKKDWEGELKQNELPTWLQLQAFLEKKCRVLEAIESSKKASSNNVNNRQSHNKTNQASSFSTTTESKSSSAKNNSNTQNSCVVCKLPYHPLYLCTEFKKLSIADRYDKIKEFKLCFNCFNSNHVSRDCLRGTCKHCSKKHNSLLHKEKTNKADSNENENSDKQTHTTLLSQFVRNKSLFPTAMVLIKDKSGKWKHCRALLDSASDANLVSSEFLQKCSVSVNANENTTITSLNKQKTVSLNTVDLTIKSCYNKFEKNLKCSIVPTIVNALPENDIEISNWYFPPNIKLADPLFNRSRKIDILIGNELFFEIIKSKQISLKPNATILQESVFGYLVVGPYNNNYSNYATFANFQQPDISELNDNLKHFWEIESYPEKQFLSKSEEMCEQHFSTTYLRDQEGRFIVDMPLTNDVNNLGNSKMQALKRFYSLESKLYSDPELKEQYFKFINEYINLNHMKKIAEPIENEQANFYLPHHGVLKLSSSTTKLRVVFDASAESSSGLSLNDVMLVGPTIQQDLFNIILRFRKHSLVMTADIEKMYRQVKINPNQTKFLRILWRFNKTDPIQTYELQTVTYGTASAPYLATKALMQLTKDETRFPIASKVAREDFYVDDILTGSDSIEECLEIQNQLIKLLATGGFHLYKWCSNSETLLDNIPIKDREILQITEISEHESIKALGLLWKPKQDVFGFDIQTLNKTALTKRSILSEIAKIYDPLGLLSPVTITAKILIQTLWKNQYDWDKVVPVEIGSMWSEYSDQLSSIKNIQINRCIILNNSKHIELHGFSDASEKAYGACVLIKCVNDKNEVSVNLVCSKTRVAPLKVISLPRLELCAALLLSRLINSVIQSLKLNYDNIILWSDSQITLHWINLEPHKLKTFVANRVSEIQELTHNFKWKFIESNNNAADVISRGIFPKELENLSSWWEGPTFLKTYDSLNDVNSFDKENLLNSDVNLLELKSPNELCLSTKIQELELFNRYSSLDRLLRITAICIRFFNNLRDKPNQKRDNLSVVEITHALSTLVRIVQLSEFDSEIKQLSKGKDICHNSKIKNLNPFLDDQQLLRVGGRLSNSEYAYDIKHQLILPYKHNLTELICRQEHEKNLHAGPQLLLSLIRQRFWPIKGKLLVKQIVRNCVTCCKNKPKLSHQLMGNLPVERTKPNKPFNTTGVDLCGPFHLKIKYNRKGSTYKIYVATFICFVTKAVHLEIVSDLTSEAFLACLKRFLYRRGNCNTMWSDNATNFVGCNNEFQKQKRFLSKDTIDDKILNYCVMNQINWKFIPPNAPNFGGLWEASVKSFKFHLKRVTNNVIFYYEEFNTLIIQIEGIMNSRPLYDMSNDPSEPEPLTPAHFLTGGKILAPPEISYENVAENRLTTWKRLEQLTQSFWKRFSVEYIHTLQQRQKWKNSTPNININDIVLISNESSQPTNWLLGKIIKVIPGIDNKIRVVDIKTQNGILRRPISKICRLPIES